MFDVIDENPETFNRVRHEICVTIIETFAGEGIQFAYPTQTALTAAPDGRLIMPYPEAEPAANTPAGPRTRAKPAT